MKTVYLALFFSLLITACSEQTVEVQKEVIRPVKAFTLTEKSADHIRNFPGLVEATENAVLSFRVPGELITLDVKPGQRVAKGAVIATLDPKDYKLNVDRAQADYDLAKSQYSRAEQLVDEKLISASDFDTAYARFKSAESQLSARKNELEYTVLKAPFDTTVAKVHLENFESIQAKQPIITAQDLNVIDIAIQVPEAIMFRLRKGNDYRPSIIFENEPSKSFLADLKEFNTEPDASTNSFKVVFSLAAPEDFNVLPGMAATVRVELDKVVNNPITAITIPNTATFTKPGDSETSYVWIIDENMQLKSKKITVSGVNSEGIEVSEGLKAGDVIVVAGVHRLREGITVSIWQQERGL
ncbi:efflux RND transporter periplasmic adaptor subunit [Endozoicomonas sp. G2_1]|uniref:efflux RND transporter periplasmic adaptor subunit n=1 Tax=Endozoicomonas sp. G2_1 TaxID=2821091 RepID=UPI001AD9864D|nr:efflux RND transporter periplasmic adaptor subunit [Endozoicomonas sp. G2_1]MBO9490378.1 efflux RND transporter periplasmic adaptor subunit [Endozoicomonas sp. G2_1]